MNRSLSGVLRLGGRHDGPQLTLVHSLLVASDPNAVVGAVIGDIQVLVLLDALDPVHLPFLLKDESLVGSTVEAVHDQLTIAGLVLSNIESLDAVAVGCIDDVVLVGLEVDGLSESHTLVVAGVGFGDDVVDVHKLLSPVETFALVGCLLLVTSERFDQPDLIAALVNVSLKDSLTFFSLSTSNVQASPIGVSLDDVSLMSKFSLLSSLELEPTAGMFAAISDDVDSVVLFVLENAQSVVVALSDDGELIVLLVNVEVLVFVVVVLIYLKFVVFVDSQDQIGVENGVDFVENLGIGFKLGLDIGVDGSLIGVFACFIFVFLGTLGLDGDKMPKLIVSLMDVVLEDVLAFLSLSSSNI